MGLTAAGFPSVAAFFGYRKTKVTKSFDPANRNARKENSPVRFPLENKPSDPCGKGIGELREFSFVAVNELLADFMHQILRPFILKKDSPCKYLSIRQNAAK